MIYQCKVCGKPTFNPVVCRECSVGIIERERGFWRRVKILVVVILLALAGLIAYLLGVLK